MIPDESRTPIVPEASGDPARLLPVPSSWLVRGAWLFAGVGLPLLCFLLSYPVGPEWQSGELHVYAALLLSRKPSLAQYPFLLYSMTCMVVLMLKPSRFCNSTWVRLGIYSGVLLAAEYWLVFQCAIAAPTYVALPFSVAAVFAPWLLRQLLGYMLRKFGCEVVACLAVSLFFPLMISLGLFVCLLCSTPWALASYLAVSIYLLRGGGAKRFQFSLGQLLLVFTWLSLHLGAWRISFLVMLKEYAALPAAQPSHCFICSAAAKGHPRVVRSEEYLDPHGAAFRVNDQLRFLKGFELLMMSLSPNLHRACRWIYDRVGPRLAETLVHPVLADLGYMVLKPAEWAARACLALAIPRGTGLVHNIYRTQRRSRKGVEPKRCQRQGARNRFVTQRGRRTAGR